MAKAGTFGCRFDASGNYTSCGATVVNEKTGESDVAIVKDLEHTPQLAPRGMKSSAGQQSRTEDTPEEGFQEQRRWAPGVWAECGDGGAFVRAKF
jgi:hypothetical protein